MRTLVIKHYQNGDSQREIAAKTFLSRETVRYIIQKYKKTKCIGNLFGRGRKRTTAITDRLIIRRFKVDRRKSVFAAKGEIEKELGIALHVDTIRRRAQESGLFGRVARKKPYVNVKSRRKQINYAKEMLQTPVRFWNIVVWSDESKFNLFGSDRKIMVWRSCDEEFNPICTVPTVKHGGGSVTVWGCFARNGPGRLYVLDRIMDRFYYREILEQNLLPSIKKLDSQNKYVFMRDNDPKYTSGLIKDWLKKIIFKHSHGLHILQI